MLANRTTRLVWMSTFALCLVAAACSKSATTAPSVAASSSDKIPITTKSDEARKHYLEGRDLSERLLGQESLQHFDKAIEIDPEFASAELARANNSPTNQEFLEHQKKASALASQVSEGERLLILASEAGGNGSTVKQEEYLLKAVALYPNDERAQYSLANYYFGQQEYEQAAAHCKKTTEIAPSFSPAYNILGYSYRQEGDYAHAEEALKKYVELSPNDPNPYDSYAELLLKMGRFEDSIEQYHKALSVDPHFAASHYGLAGDYMYLGRSADALNELQKMADGARNDGELRTAYFGMAVVAVDGGKWSNAIQAINKQYSVAEKKNDVVAMAGDLQATGNIDVEMLKYDDAKKQFDRSFQIVDSSGVSQDIKDNAKLQYTFNLTVIAIGKKDLNAAKAQAEEFRQGAEATKNPVQIKLAHELAGRIALAQKDYDKAIAELEQANDQNPGNLFRLSQAYQAKGDNDQAREYAKKVAEFNSLPRLQYAFVRVKGQKLAGNSNS
jgi:tetratricopeptide (TPR) repeat protein